MVNQFEYSAWRRVARAIIANRLKEHMAAESISSEKLAGIVHEQDGLTLRMAASYVGSARMGFFYAPGPRSRIPAGKIYQRFRSVLTASGLPESDSAFGYLAFLYGQGEFPSSNNGVADIKCGGLEGKLAMLRPADYKFVGEIVDRFLESYILEK